MAWKLFGIIALLGALTTSSAAAQAAPYEQFDKLPPDEPNRELGGHHFPIAVFVPSALTVSYFGIRAGIEYHSVPGFSRNLSFFGEQYQQVDLQTINAAETADFAVRLFDRLAIVGDVYGLARVGANMSTLLGTGADYTYGGDLGLLVKLFRVGGFQLSVRAQAGYYAGQQAGVVDLFQDIGEIVQFNITDIQRDFQDDSSIDINQRIDMVDTAFRAATSGLLTPFRGNQYGLSLNAALGAGRFVGLQLSGGLYLDRATYDVPLFDVTRATLGRYVRQVDKVWPRLGIALDIDGSRARVPVALMLEYAVTPLHVESSGAGDPIEQSSVEHLIAVGLYYSGRTDLQLGMTGYLLLGQVPALGANALPSGQPLDVGAQFVFRYLW